MKFTYALNGQNAQSKSTQIAIFKQDFSGKALQKNGTLKFKNTGAGILYAKLSIEGVPVSGNETAASSNVSIGVNYYSMSGAKISVDKLEQGTDFIAEVTISNSGVRGYLAEMAISQVFPSGWEIHNTRMDEMQAASTISDYPTYQDFRDDRVYTYYNIPANKTKIFRFKLNAAYIGRFYLPAIATEAMYDNSIYAREPGQWVEVVKPGLMP
jgi:hypothetical protein